MEHAEVEVRALALARFLASLQPDPLAQLVRRCLPRPAQVAIQLEAQHAVVGVHAGMQELPGQHGVPGLARAPGRVRGDRQLQVHAQVHHHPGGPEQLPVQHPEKVAGVGEVPEFLHQPLRVQRPAFAMPGNPANQPLPAVQALLLEDGLRALEVMAGHALVIDRGDFFPGGELIDAVRYRPPNPARPAPVLARVGVVDPAVAGRRDHALDPAGWLRDVEMGAVQLGERGVGDILHPGPQIRPAGDPPGRIGVQRGDGVRDAATGDDQAGHPVHLGLDPLDFRPAPGVGLVQVDRRAEEVARGTGVALPAGRIALRRQRQQLGLQEDAELGRGRPGRLGGPVKLRAHRPGCLDAAGQPAVEVLAGR